MVLQFYVNFHYCGFTFQNLSTMVSDELFYHKFRDWIIGVHEREDVKEAVNDVGEDGNADGNDDPGMVDNENDQKSDRVAFFLHQMNIRKMMICPISQPVVRALSNGACNRVARDSPSSALYVIRYTHSN